MATLATQALNRAGLVATFASCAGGGDRFAPSSNTYLEVKNGGGSPQTVTVAATRVPKPNQTIGNNAVSVAAGATARIGPFPAEDYLATDGSGLADITYTGVTSLTIAVVQLQQP